MPYRGRWTTLPAGKRSVISSHAKIRAVGEQANAILKSWRFQRRLRCSTIRITAIVKADLVLYLATAQDLLRYERSFPARLMRLRCPGVPVT